MSILIPAYRLPFQGWRQSSLIFFGSALAFGLPAVMLATYGVTLDGLQVPVLPSGVAFVLLLAFGWRAMPGIVAGAAAAAVWFTLHGSPYPYLTAIGWILLLPLGAPAQGAISYSLASKISPTLLETSSHWQYWSFLLLSIPAGSTLGALFVFFAMGPASAQSVSDGLIAGALWWLLDIAAALALTTFALGFFSKSSRPFLPVAMLSGVAVTILGVAVAYGWITNNLLLIRLDDTLSPMVFNSAISFVLCGSGLLALVAGNLRLARILGIALIFLGALTYFQYVFKVDLRIDGMFYADTAPLNLEHPGRMAASSALCVFLYGLALCQLTFGVLGNVVPTTLFSFVTSVGIIRFVSHMAVIDVNYGWAQMSPMSLHAAAAWVTLGLGGLAREFSRSETDQRHVNLSPIPTGVVLAAMSVWIWQAVYHGENEKIRRLAQERAIDLTRVIDKEIIYHNNTMVRMASRWQTNPYKPAEWASSAQLVLRDFPSIAALAWADAESYIRWLVPIEGHEDIVGFQLSGNPHGADVLRRVHETGLQVSSDTIKLRSMGKGFIMFTPTFVDGKIEGYLLGLYRIDKLFEKISPSMDNYMYRIFEGDMPVFISHENRPWPTDPVESAQVVRDMRGKLWKLELVPKPEWLDRQRSNLPLLILFAGLFLSCLTTYALYLLEAVRRHCGTIELNENRLRQVFNCAPTGLITADRHGVVEVLNPEAARQFGYSPAEMAGQPMQVLVPGQFSESQLAEMLREAGKMTKNGRSDSRELVALKKNGESFPIEVAITPYKTQDGVQILALVTDISERNEAQRKLLAYTRELEVTNRDLDDFAYVASHDLRAPLTAIGSLVAWLEEDTADVLSESSTKHLDLIKNRVARMGKLLEDLLAYSRAGRTTNSLEMVDMTEMVAQVADLLRGTGSLEVRSIDLPVFETVRIPFLQIFRNLMANSFKHHDRDTCTIEISVQDSGPFYTFRVQDDGPGIPPEYRDKVFNMFQTLRPRDEVEGSGMGLALVRRLVERYDGKVFIVPTEGRGTCVEFTWPKIIKGG